MMGVMFWQKAGPTDVALLAVFTGVLFVALSEAMRWLAPREHDVRTLAELSVVLTGLGGALVVGGGLAWVGLVWRGRSKRA